jgi:hypothetical protein
LSLAPSNPEVQGLARYQQANDETKKTQDGAEDLDDKNPNEAENWRISTDTGPTEQRRNSHGRIRGIGQRSSATIDAHGNATDEVAHADCQARPEQRKARIVGVGRVQGLALDEVDLGGKDDGHDDAVNGHHFAENDGYEILILDPWCFHARAEDG